ncbi:MAG TPA: uracil-DNA glycosylase [Longimicrobiales bacterium]|nr:uracil-DNA glycosylase [Longimicrobiales bacterium]
MSDGAGGALSALLRQLRDRGESDLYLQDLDAREAVRLARRARAEAARAGVVPPPGAAIAPVRAATGTPPGAAAAPSGPPNAPARPAPASDDARRLTALAAAAAGCTRCRLCEGRTQVVWGDGQAGAAVMVVGEAPGREEDRTGLPFVGPAGKLLDLLLASVGLPRERVYIGNVIKCRPPGNRDPMADEVEACAGWLRDQIDAVGPSALLAVGRFAAQRLMGSDRPLGRLRGSVGQYEGVPVIATYHPAFLLRSPEFTTTAWEDLQLLRRTVDEGAR